MFITITGLLITECAQFLLLYPVLLIFAHSCILMATLGIVLIQMVLVKLAQIRQILIRKPNSIYFGINYSAFLKQNIKLLSLILKANNPYGQALLIYISVNCPVNCAFMAILLVKPLTLIQDFFIIIFMGHQFICIFGIHLFMANLNKKIHKPVKMVFHLLVEDKNFFINKSKVLLKLKLDNYIGAFHTKNKYGIQYGSGGRFGLVTIKSFSKVIFYFVCFNFEIF